MIHHMQTQEIEVLERHTQALNDHAKALAMANKPDTPLDKTPWDSDEYAGYLRVSVQTFRNQYACAPTFPQPIKAETAKGKGHPRWNAQEVIDWFFSHGHEVARRRKSRK